MKDEGEEIQVTVDYERTEHDQHLEEVDEWFVDFVKSKGWEPGE